MPPAQSLISSKYQTVIPAEIRQKLDLKKGDKLFWRIVRAGKQPKIIAEPEPKSWAKRPRGLGKDIWQKTNIDRYIKDLRWEWPR